ncbi:hypothetical protein C9374_008961 [Naegleria lovaniensis]|uniref:Protein kinase domain-containing protein n=1 Tax=Naegleria lovaniensis TaxID=51637 RepID=A0AA88KH66_NAELO|nr:uncharacterized protein C9374_014321 [Naegleria lovaniensis]XP_044545138.1 uncharacterized protein C9374_008961 [Naegleria lovaniensis]KAG2370690.1 hypothetical protein C9374_014321 [Naegleria lovaniensis]KAG2377876.1 hypothetical protein C9374_008961 [Naegleria lovaniensis]
MYGCLNPLSSGPHVHKQPYGSSSYSIILSKINILLSGLLYLIIWMPILSLYLHRHQDTENYHFRRSVGNDSWWSSGSSSNNVFALVQSNVDWNQASDNGGGPFNRTMMIHSSTTRRKTTSKQQQQQLSHFACYRDNFTNFDLVFHVGNNETVEKKGHFHTMTGLFQYISYIMLEDSDQYTCLRYNMTVFITSDIVEELNHRNTVCGNTIPSFDASKSIVRVFMNIRSENSEDKKVLQCSSDNPVFLFDSASIAFLTFSHMSLKEMMIRPVTITNSIITSSVIQLLHGIDEAGISDTKLVITQTKASEVGILTLHNVTMHSGSMSISNCAKIHFEFFYFREDVTLDVIPILKVSNSETFYVAWSTFIFGDYFSIQMEAVIEAIFFSCKFDFIHSPNSPLISSSEYGMVGNLLFRFYLIGCSFNNRNHDHGWLKIISAGVTNIENVHVANNTCSKAEGIFYFYLCQTIYISDSLFTNNTAKHSGSLLFLSSKTFHVLNTKFIDNNSVKSGGAVTVLECHNSAQLTFKRTLFIRNAANNGNGGGIAIIDTKSFVIISDVIMSQNRATLGGGAIYCNNVTYLYISKSQFDYNVAHHHDNDEKCITTSFLSGGSGGAMSLFQTPLEMTDVKLIANKATRGGALFATSKALMYVTEFTNNVALVAGGACFFVKNSSQVYQWDVFMQNNQATVYGQNTATPISTFSQEVLEPMANNGKLVLYPGATLVLKFTDMYDRNNNFIPIMYECPISSISDSRFYLVSNNSHFESNVIYFTLRIASRVEINIDEHPVDTEILISFTESETTNISVTIGPCPMDYIINDGQCEMGFPLSKVIPGIVVGSILLLLVGIILGSCMCSACAFSVWRIFKNARSLYVRQQSEREIEEKLLNYDVSFSHYGSLNSDTSSTIEKNTHYVIPVTELKIEKKIGEGASGSVYKAKYNMMDVAVKTIIRKDDTHQDFEKEVMLLVKLRHPNIICFYGICISESQLCIVVELGQNGSLEQMIKDIRKGKIKKKFRDKLKILIGVANGMKYLHGLQPHYLIHRDLKPANIILDQSYTPKVCDFGLSRVVSMNTQTNSLTGNVGTLLYMSPELILEEDSETNKLARENATKIDVYSYAIIMYELFFEETPYWNEDSEKINYFHHCNSDQKKVKAFNLLYQVANHEKRPLIPFKDHEEMKQWCEKFMVHDNTSNEDVFIGVDMYVKLMQQCWSSNPTERPSFERIMHKLTEIYNLEF